MITKTVLPFKLETTQDTITAHAGLALLGEFAHGIGLPDLVDGCLPSPGSGAGYRPSQFVMPMVGHLAENGLVVVRRPAQGDLFDEENPKVRYKVIASNSDESAEETVRWYNARGEHSENRIKELKIGPGMERMPCGQFRANAVFFRIGVLAYYGLQDRSENPGLAGRG